MRTERQGWRNSRAWPEGEIKYTHPRVHTGTYTQQLGSWGNSLSADQELTGELQTYLTLSTLGQDETPQARPKGCRGDRDDEPMARAALTQCREDSVTG